MKRSQMIDVIVDWMVEPDNTGNVATEQDKQEADKLYKSKFKSIKNAK